MSVSVNPLDYVNANIDKLRCVNPDSLMLFEYREEEMVGGIILMAVSTGKFNQVSILPKWRVIAVGDNIEKELGIARGDLVIVGRMSGKLRTISDNVQVRMVDKTDVLAKVIPELKDYETFILQSIERSKQKNGR